MPRQPIQKETQIQKMVAVNFRLKPDFRDRLIALACADHRTLSSLMTKMVDDYLTANGGVGA